MLSLMTSRTRANPFRTFGFRSTWPSCYSIQTSRHRTSWWWSLVKLITFVLQALSIKTGHTLILCKFMQQFAYQNKDQATGAVASFCFLPVLVETARADDKQMIIEAWSQQTHINKFNLLNCRSHCFTIGSQVTAYELATKLSWDN